LEHEIAWALHTVQAMDYVYTQRAQRAGWHRFPDGCCRATTSGPTCRSASKRTPWDWTTSTSWASHAGVGSDYPHHETTFPQSRQILEHAFAHLGPAEREAILRTNPSRLYGFDI